MDQGIIHVYTGNGKGKTTAAIGLAFRGNGYGLKSAMVQFIKGTLHYGELTTAQNTEFLEIFPMGKGFVGIMGDDKPRREHEEAAEKALEFAYQTMMSRKYDLIILDEVNNAIALGLISKKAVIKLIKDKPTPIHLVLTGRDAHPDVIKLADLTTEMKMVKHYFDEGRPAIKGIEL